MILSCPNNDMFSFLSQYFETKNQLGNLSKKILIMISILFIFKKWFCKNILNFWLLLPELYIKISKHLVSGSFKCQFQLNIKCLTMKFHNCKHANMYHLWLVNVYEVQWNFKTNPFTIWNLSCRIYKYIQKELSNG